LLAAAAEQVRNRLQRGAEAAEHDIFDLDEFLDTVTAAFAAEARLIHAAKRRGFRGPGSSASSLRVHRQDRQRRAGRRSWNPKDPYSDIFWRSGRRTASQKDAIQRKVTNGYRAMWAAQTEADVRTTIDTARLKGANPFDVILATIA